MMRPLNRKARDLLSAEPRDVRAWSSSDCCPGFQPGWEVGYEGVDPCPWQADLPACHPCFWSAQVPDETTYPTWMDACANIVMDWKSLCIVPDL